jgi:hypothetical protein
MLLIQNWVASNDITENSYQESKNPSLQMAINVGNYCAIHDVYAFFKINPPLDYFI